MKPTDIPDPTIIDHILGSLERYPFATLALIVLVALMVMGRWQSNKRD